MVQFKSNIWKVNIFKIKDRILLLPAGQFIHRFATPQRESKGYLE